MCWYLWKETAWKGARLRQCAKWNFGLGQHCAWGLWTSWNALSLGKSRCNMLQFFFFMFWMFWSIVVLISNHFKCTSDKQLWLVWVDQEHVLAVFYAFTHWFNIWNCNKGLRSRPEWDEIKKISQSERCILLVGELGRLCFGHALHGLLRFLLGFWMSLTSMLCAKASFHACVDSISVNFRQCTMWKAYLHAWRHILHTHT